MQRGRMFTRQGAAREVPGVMVVAVATEELEAPAAGAEMGYV
jgi:hypothetical protein